MNIKFRCTSKNFFSMREAHIIIDEIPVKLVMSTAKYSNINGVFILEKLISTNDATIENNSTIYKDRR